jgi:hypothetical protein
MKKIMGGVTLICLIFLFVSWESFGPVNRVLAQNASGQLTDQQRREMEKKYQEDWKYQQQLRKEQADTGARLEKGVKRRQDAEKRQREAERKLRELERQGK